MMKKTMRKGYGLKQGQGYKNLMPMDSHIHSLSAKGQKTSLYACKNKPNKSLYAKKGKTGSCVHCGMKFSAQDYKKASQGVVGDDCLVGDYDNICYPCQMKYGTKKAREQSGFDAKGVKSKVILNAKLTSIKSNASKEVIVDGLNKALKKKGYDVNVIIQDGHIDTGKIRLSDKYLDEKGYNVSSWSGRRGRYLSWDNWVDVNNTINDVLDKYDTSANVSSLGGKFKIRQGKKRMTEDDWSANAYDNVGSMMNPVTRRDNWSPEGIPRKRKVKKK